MSLTGFLKQSGATRSWLQEHFPYSLREISFPSVQAIPLTTNYALVGQAFDYLLRFQMQRHNPHAPQQSPWVANIVKASLSGDGDNIQQRRQEETAALPFLENAHIHHEQFLSTGEVTDALLKSCLDLAIMDGLARAGEMRGTLGNSDPKDLRDLRHLQALIPTTPFFDSGPCILNPVFSFPSGTDCDLLINNTLIEIKTTKFSGVKREYYHQLLGYYLLNLHEKRSYPIQRIGVYFLRHGYLWSIDVQEIAPPDAFLSALPRWNELVQDYHDMYRLKAAAPTYTGQELLAQANALSGVSSYLHWLSQLSPTNFDCWKKWPTAPYFVMGALEFEQERRAKTQQTHKHSIASIGGGQRAEKE